MEIVSYFLLAALSLATIFLVDIVGYKASACKPQQQQKQKTKQKTH